MSRNKCKKLVELDTQGRDSLLIKDGKGNAVWRDHEIYGNPLYLEIDTMEKIARQVSLTRVNLEELNHILEAAWLHKEGFMGDPYAIPNQVSYRAFVKQWDAMCEENKAYIAGHLGAIYGKTFESWRRTSEAQQITNLMHGLLKLKGRGAPKKPNITKARDYLFEHCAQFCHGLEIRITTSSDDLNFFLIMRAILEDRNFADLAIREVNDHIKTTSLCTR